MSMTMTMKQRNMKDKKIAFLGAKIDEKLHKEIKYAAIRRGVSMSTLVEQAIRNFVETELKQEG